MSLNENIKNLSKLLKEVKLDSLAHYKKSCAKLDYMKSKINLEDESISSALSIIYLTHGEDVLKALPKNLFGQALAEEVKSKAMILSSQMTKFISEDISKYLKFALNSSNFDENQLFNLLSLSEVEKETFTLNTKMLNKDLKTISSEDLIALIFISMKKEHSALIHPFIFDFYNVQSSEGIADLFKEKEKSLYEARAIAFKTFLSEEKDEINKTKFLKKLGTKAKKQLYVAELFSNGFILQSKKVKTQNSKYLILEDSSSVLLNNADGQIVKYYNNRLEEYSNGVLIKVTFITKPITVLNQIDTLLGKEIVVKPKKVKTITNEEMRAFEEKVTEDA